MSSEYVNLLVAIKAEILLAVREGAVLPKSFVIRIEDQDLLEVLRTVRNVKTGKPLSLATEAFSFDVGGMEVLLASDLWKQQTEPS